MKKFLVLLFVGFLLASCGEINPYSTMGGGSSTGGNSGGSGSGGTGGSGGGSGGGSSGGGDNSGGAESLGVITLKSGSNAITSTDTYDYVDVLLVATEEATPTVSTSTSFSSYIEAKPINNELSINNTPISDIEPISKNLLQDVQPRATIICSTGSGATTKTFTDVSYHSSGTVTATYVGENDDAYFYLDTTQSSEADTVTDLITSYGEIYKKVENIFKHSAAKDSDGKIAILFTALSGNSGFFSANDKLVRGKGDILYINITAASFATDAKYTFAHELQHMLIYDNRYAKMSPTNIYGNYTGELWLNEGLAMYAEDAAFDNTFEAMLTPIMFTAFAASYSTVPLTSLTASDSDIYEKYAYSAFFVHYLVDRFGEGILAKIYTSTSINTAAIVEAAKSMDTSFTGTFNDLFNDFIQALYLSNAGISVTDKRYAFKTINIKKLGLSFKSFTSTGNPYTGNLKKYGFDIVKFPNKPTNITLSNMTNVKAYAIPRKN